MRHPEMTQLELGRILLEERDPLKVLVHRYGYSRARLKQLRALAEQQAIANGNIDPP